MLKNICQNHFNQSWENTIFSTSLHVLIHPLKMELLRWRNSYTWDNSTLLFQMQVPKQFWADAVSTAFFLINRMPSTVLACNVPYNVLFPNNSLFPIEPKVFGSTCYVRDVRPSVTMLDPKALKCIFLVILVFGRVSILFYRTLKIFGINWCGIFIDYTFLLCTSHFY